MQGPLVLKLGRTRGSVAGLEQTREWMGRLGAASGQERPRPEDTLLHRVVAACWPRSACGPPTEDGLVPAKPSLGGWVDEIEQARAYEALFKRSAEPRQLGRYVVLDSLGQGGMGVVLRAYDRELDRTVALKVLHREIDEQHTQRLRREAQAMAKLSHPNVVQVYEVGEVEGQTFVAMELVKGKTLCEWMQRQPRPGWRECVELFVQVGAGLAAAHERGLVHRDFKPGNAIVDEKGRPRVLDFGAQPRKHAP
jgi:predicted Ser/Thr protein kinase